MRRILLLCSLLTWASSASAATYYVNQSGGSDSNSCATAQTITTPKASINGGTRCLSAGDTLQVRAGVYVEGLTAASFPNSGTSLAGIRVTNYSVELVTMKPSAPPAGAPSGAVVFIDGNLSYIVIAGINIDGSLLSAPQGNPACTVGFSTNNGNNPNHLTLTTAEIIAGSIGGSAAVCTGGHTTIGATGANQFINLKIHGGGLPGQCGFLCASYGIYLAGPNNLVDQVEIYGVSGAGIQVYNAGADPPNNNIIRNTRIHDITVTGDLGEVWGIDLAGASNTQIYNVIIWNINVSGGSGGTIVIFNSGGLPSNNNLVANCTIFSNTNGPGIYVFSGSGNVVQNCISYLESTPYTDSATGTVQSNNLFGVNPNFASAPSNVMPLTGSPAINAGVTLSQFSTDIDGRVRPAGSWTIGACQYVNGAQCPGGTVSPPAAPTHFRLGVFLQSPSSSPAAVTLGNAQLALTGGGLDADGDLVATNPNAAIVGSAAPVVALAGHCSGPCAQIGALYTGVSPPTDPLSGVSLPTNPGGCTAGTASSLSPGCYTSIANTVQTLSAGTYYVTGTVTVGRLTGSGVLLFLTSGGKIVASVGSSLTLSAPTSGTWEGIAILQDPADANPLTIPDGFALSLNGAIYAPASDLSIANLFNLAAGSCVMIVAHSLTIENGSATLSNASCSSTYTAASFFTN